MICAFWASFSLVLYSYAIYPIAIAALARCFGAAGSAPPDPPAGGWPSASLVLAAFNEESVLAARLENALATDYPPDRFEVVVGSDGSTDRTAEVARGFADRGVRLVEFPGRRGKAAVLNDIIPALEAEIVLLSDANTLVEPDAARRLIRWFARAEIGSVCGRLELIDPATGANADGIYWRYENFLKRHEARLGALLGANGAIYAIRRRSYAPIPPGLIIDDFAIPLLSGLRGGGSIAYEPAAVAREESAPDLAAEFRRRGRIGAGGFQSLALLWPLLDPRRGWVALAFFSHKLLRWLCPFFLLAMLGANLALIGARPWGAILAAQVGFYAASLLAPAGSSPLLRPIRLAAMFTRMNAALLVGFWGWARGTQGGTWTPTPRPDARPEGPR